MNRDHKPTPESSCAATPPSPSSTELLRGTEAERENRILIGILYQGVCFIKAEMEQKLGCRRRGRSR
jgi:hypothetical protein